MDSFKEINPETLNENVFRLIGRDWMLVTAGTPENYNMMTASWGGLGVLWNKNVSYIVIRPSRHTFGFIEKSGFYTISFLGGEHRKTLNFCGSKSGRDVDKMHVDGLSPVNGPSGTVYFSEARLVLVCKKIYFQDLDPAHFLDPAIESNYPDKDYHRMYVGEIAHCLVK